MRNAETTKRAASKPHSTVSRISGEVRQRFGDRHLSQPAENRRTQNNRNPMIDSERRIHGQILMCVLPARKNVWSGHFAVRATRPFQKVDAETNKILKCKIQLFLGLNDHISTQIGAREKMPQWANFSNEVLETDCFDVRKKVVTRLSNELSSKPSSLSHFAKSRESCEPHNQIDERNFPRAMGKAMIMRQHTRTTAHVAAALESARTRQ